MAASRRGWRLATIRCSRVADGSEQLVGEHTFGVKELQCPCLFRVSSGLPLAVRPRCLSRRGPRGAEKGRRPFRVYAAVRGCPVETVFSVSGRRGGRSERLILVIVSE